MQPVLTSLGGVEPLPWACFGALSPWELVDSDRRKLSGLAQQRRTTGIALVSGTLLWRPPWSMLCEAFDRNDALEALTRRTTDCESIREAAHESIRESIREAARLAPPDERRRTDFAARVAAAIDAALASTLGSG